MNHQFVLPWQKDEKSEINKVTILGLFKLLDVDVNFCRTYVSDWKLADDLYDSSKIQESIVEDTKKVFSKVILSQYNITKFNSFDLIVSDSIPYGLDIIKSNEITFCLLSTPSLQDKRYNTQSTIEALEMISQANYHGKIIGILHGYVERSLKNECYLRKIPFITLEESCADFNHKCYRFALELAVRDFFLKPENNKSNNFDKKMDLPSTKENKLPDIEQYY
jgi:hypothetical protein